MSIKSIHSSSEEVEMAEAVLSGPGGTSICLIDATGKVLLTKRIRVSGPEKVMARTRLPLTLRLDEEDRAVVPMIVFQTNQGQTATLSGRSHGEVTDARCRAIGLDPARLREVGAAREAAERALWGGRTARALDAARALSTPKA